jgi:hypothetical protein
MSNIIPIDQAARTVSPLMRARMAAGKGLNQNFSDGIRDAFPTLSIKGKVFRARISGQETPFIDQQTRQPIGALDLIMVNASRTIAKSFYVRGFTEGDMNPPDCWSLDSVRPDPSVPNKVSPVCGTCPMNAFGSRVTEAGKAAKACSDARRIAVMMPHQVNDAQPMVLMLRVPQSSLKNLKAYSQLLERHGMEPGGVITRLAFDYQEAFPKLLFNFVAPLPEAEYQHVIDLAEGDLVQGMLITPDFDNAPSTQPVQQTTTISGMVPQAPPVLETASIQAEAPVIPGITIPSTPPMQVVNAAAVGVQRQDGLMEVSSHLIELPDNKWFDTATNQYVAPPQPQVQMPQLDPTTISLPEGKYFNTVRKEYVTGPELGAKAIGLEQPTTRERKPRTKKPVQPDEAPQPAMDAAPTTSAQTVETPAQQPNGAAPEGVKPVVTAAPAALSEILGKLLPPNTQQ